MAEKNKVSSWGQGSLVSRSVNSGGLLDLESIDFTEQSSVESVPGNKISASEPLTEEVGLLYFKSLSPVSNSNVGSQPAPSPTFAKTKDGRWIRREAHAGLSETLFSQAIIAANSSQGKGQLLAQMAVYFYTLLAMESAYCTDDEYAYVSLPYYRGGDLHGAMGSADQKEQSRWFQASVAKRWALFARLLEDVEKVHTEGFCLNDIKPENITVELDDNDEMIALHLIDLGACTTPCGGGESTEGYFPAYADRGKLLPSASFNHDYYALKQVFEMAFFDVLELSPEVEAHRQQGKAFDQPSFKPSVLPMKVRHGLCGFAQAVTKASHKNAPRIDLSRIDLYSIEWVIDSYKPTPLMHASRIDQLAILRWMSQGSLSARQFEILLVLLKAHVARTASERYNSGLFFGVRSTLFTLLNEIPVSGSLAVKKKDACYVLARLPSNLKATGVYRQLLCYAGQVKALSEKTNNITALKQYVKQKIEQPIPSANPQSQGRFAASA